MNGEPCTADSAAPGALLREVVAESTTPIDVGVLRKVLRLVHCIQKERGASCAYRAAASNYHPPVASSVAAVTTVSAPHRAAKHTLVPSRRDTDRAFAMLLAHHHQHHRHPYSHTGSKTTAAADGNGTLEQATLQKIRKMVMDHHPVESKSASPNFHQILVCYNTLIQSMLHEHVLKHAIVAAKSHRKNTATNRNRIPRLDENDKVACNLPRAGSYQALQMFDATIHPTSCNTSAGATRIPPQLHHHERWYPTTSERNTASIQLLSTSAPGRLQTQRWDDRLPFSLLSEQLTSPRPTDRELFLNSHDSWSIGPDDTRPSTFPRQVISCRDDTVDGIDDDDDEYYQSASGTFLEAVKFDDSFKGGVKIDAGPENGYDLALENHGNFVDTNSSGDDGTLLVHLFSLLETFVRLKESIGVERAILSSMLAAGQADGRLMITDLLLELENQRRHVGKLTKLLPQAGVLYNLVRELVSMSPQMKQLQNSISQGFDLDSLKCKFDSHGKLWNLLTLYMDKLHSLELILVEEIECNVGLESQQLDSSSIQPSDFTTNVSTDVSVAAAGGWVACNPIDWLRAFDMDSRSTIDDFRNRVEALTPNDLKYRLLRALATGESPPEEPSPPTEGVARGVDELLAQLSKAPASKEWEIDLYEIRFQKRIGQGTAGTTYLADWSGLKVAVKVASISELGLDGFRNEVHVLQKLHHPNIVRLLGSVCHPSPLTFCLVLEYCDVGDLSEVLTRPTPSNFFFHVADGMAKGGAYLHKKGVIHRDIKPGNILLLSSDGLGIASGQFNVKLTDFGVSTDSSLTNRTAETGTYRWMAGEVIRHENYSQSADVYSFAVVLWQLITREEPFQNKSQVEAASAVAFQYARPPFPDNTPMSIQTLVETCWSNEPDERLTFEQVITDLQTIEKALMDKDRTWIQAPLGHSVYDKPQITANDDRAFLPITKQSPASRQMGVTDRHVRDDKKKKTFRTLFNRKSVHF